MAQFPGIMTPSRPSAEAEPGNLHGFTANESSTLFRHKMILHSLEYRPKCLHVCPAQETSVSSSSPSCQVITRVEKNMKVLLIFELGWPSAAYHIKYEIRTHPREHSSLLWGLEQGMNCENGLQESPHASGGGVPWF